jgi:hypothetical protein
MRILWRAILIKLELKISRAKMADEATRSVGHSRDLGVARQRRPRPSFRRFGELFDCGTPKSS